jgi:hypothetical protein
MLKTPNGTGTKLSQRKRFTVHFRTVLHAAECDGCCPLHDSFLIFQNRKEGVVFTPNRRTTPRFKLQTSLYFNRAEQQSDSGYKAKTINISSTGVCFATSLAVSVGEAIELFLEIPRRVTGATAIARRFTGRITHINSCDGPAGHSRIGVQLLYGEAVTKLRTVVIQEG